MRTPVASRHLYTDTRRLMHDQAGGRTNRFRLVQLTSASGAASQEIPELAQCPQLRRGDLALGTCEGALQIGRI